MLKLTDRPDIELISDIKENNSSDSLIELTSRHQGLVTEMIRKYSNENAQCSGVNFAELLQDKDFLIFEAVKDYKTKFNTKFSTWLGTKVRFHCLNTLKKQNKYYNPSDPEITESIIDSQSDCELNDKLIQEETEYIMSLVEQMRDPRIKIIIRQRYFSENKKDRSFDAIAKNLNMSKQGVINIHSDFLNFIKKKVYAKFPIDKI